MDGFGQIALAGQAVADGQHVLGDGLAQRQRQIAIDDAARMLLEGVLQERVRQLCLLHRWRYYHTHRSKHSPAGFPDTCAVRGDRLLFSELKREAPRHKPSTEQQEWLDDLQHIADLANRHAGVEGPRIEVYLWRPSDLLSGRIEEILR